MVKMQNLEGATISNINICSYKQGSIENVSGVFKSNIHDLWRSFIMKDRIYQYQSQIPMGRVVAL